MTKDLQAKINHFMELLDNETKVDIHLARSYSPDPVALDILTEGDLTEAAAIHVWIKTAPMEKLTRIYGRTLKGYFYEIERQKEELKKNHDEAFTHLIKGQKLIGILSNVLAELLTRIGRGRCAVDYEDLYKFLKDKTKEVQENG